MSIDTASGVDRMEWLDLTFPEAAAWTPDEVTIRQLFQSVLSRYTHRDHLPFQLGLCGLKVTSADCHQHTIAYHPVRIYWPFDKEYHTAWCPVSNNYARNHLLTRVDEQPPILFVGESETWSFTIAFAAVRGSFDKIYSTRLIGDVPKPDDWERLKASVLSQSADNIRDMKQSGTFLFQEDEVERRLTALRQPDFQGLFGTGVNATTISVPEEHRDKLCNIWFQCPWTENAAPSSDISDQMQSLSLQYKHPADTPEGKIERTSRLCKRFFESAARHQSENDHIFVGVNLNKQFYSTTYDIVGLRILAKTHGYQFIGIDWDSMDVMCNFGYGHRTSSGCNRSATHREAVRNAHFAVLIFRKKGSESEGMKKDIPLTVLS
ncbi:hypothetical protein HDU85_001104 [Gaertneriomyces sp. JEL0708]|nr:hypothetical protein HDU85_001104 [Gaertneriomyces sp. JEL0708]